MTTFDIDFKRENIRARLPASAVVKGEAAFDCGLLLEGNFEGGLLKTGSTTIIAEGAKLSGFADIKGDLYVLGSVAAERVVVQGVVHLASTSVVSGFLIADDFKLYSGCKVNAALTKRDQ